MSGITTKLKKFIRKPSLIICTFNNMGLLRFLSDEQCSKLMYRIRFGRKLNLDNPQTYNEKLHWMKLRYRNPLYTKLADKYEVREYIAKTVGEEYLIPLLGVYDSFDDIDFDKLPNQFVIKCNHDSGGLVICRDKSKLDIDATRKKINKSLKRNFYDTSREWPYKNIKPRIIIEKYMVDESGYELKDYKFFCFGGKARVLFLTSDRGTDEETKFDFYDIDFNHIDCKNGRPNSDKELKKPAKYEDMVRLAEKLSEGFPHARIDLYNINGRLYFGEITFFSGSGLTPLEPEKWDRIFGDWFVLPKSNVSNQE